MQLDRHAAFQVQEVRVSVTPLHRKDKIESGSQDCAVPLSETTNRKVLIVLVDLFLYENFNT